MENIITLGKLIGLLFLFGPPPLYFVLNERNDLTRPVMGTIFLVILWESKLLNISEQGRLSSY